MSNNYLKKKEVSMFTVDDVTIYDDASNSADCLERLNNVLSNRYRYSDDAVRSYGTRPIDIDNIKLMDSIQSFEQAEATAKYILRSYQWTQAFMKALPRLIVDSSWDGRYKHSGLDIKFPSQYLGRYYKLTRDSVVRELSAILSPVPGYEDDQAYLPLIFAESKLRNEHTGNPSVGIVDRAVWLSRRQNIIESLRDKLADSYGISFASNYENYQWDIRLQLGHLTIARVNTILEQYAHGSAIKLGAGGIFSLRNQLLSEQSTRQARLDMLKLQQSGERFTKFWETIKATTPQPADAAYASWLAIPLADTGTDASRTWGIEIETVRANETSRPMGWEDKDDGSLSCGCDCDCDDCYNGEHCEYDDCTSSMSGREYVSPILEYYNSRGLRHLCGDLGAREDEDTSPGIHVHVGAGDLSIADVSRLLLNYSIIEKLLEPIYRRQVRNYCRPTTVDTLRWWLQQVRKYRNLHPDSVPSPRDLVNDSPQDRYSDVNLHALRHHGTIEFRAMGPWYDYDYLVRWAWFVREMVNVSKLGIAQREWTACRQLDDVIALLRKYGTEMPSNQLFADKSLTYYDISATEC